MGFYQVLRSIGLSVGSALAAALLTAHTLAGRTYPSFAGFRITLLVASGLCVLTALLSYILPGRTAERLPSMPEEVTRTMEEQAEIEGVGLTLAGDSIGVEPKAVRK
jgi:hypothetical protein